MEVEVRVQEELDRQDKRGLNQWENILLKDRAIYHNLALKSHYHYRPRPLRQNVLPTPVDLSISPW